MEWTQILVCLTAAGVLWDNTIPAESVTLAIVYASLVLAQVQQIVTDVLTSLMLFIMASNV